MSAYRSDGASKNAYIQRTLKAERHDGTVFGVGKLLCDSGGIGADLFRHAMLLIGVVGLVGIAAGALTGCPLYENTLNWVTSLFCR